MFKPTRGPQRAAFSAKSGISQFQLIKFLEGYQRALERKGVEGAVDIEILIDYFKNDYDDSKPLVFDSVKLGL